jgi:hypothetical protein
MQEHTSLVERVERSVCIICLQLPEQSGDESSTMFFADEVPLFDEHFSAMRTC